MGTTDLNLVEPGSLQRPGSLGRIVRIALGFMCASLVKGLLEVSGQLLTVGGQIRSFMIFGLLAGLYLISYVVNIGFSRDWKKWPAIVSAAIFVAISGFGIVTEGRLQTELLARALWAWQMYVFIHLGAAFIIAGLIGTPGCEMRAFHDLYSRLTGKPTKEHYCPVGPLHPIDRWEAKRARH
ncbi:MAG: hypothetical protein R3192_02175 [Woeseiaceae bacterium]|nr:hypothetical protein [Woeseiaceae bacterium]